MTSYNPSGVSQGGFRVTLAGVDITNNIDENSIDIKDTLGQGAGSGSGSSPRASTFSILSSLGPAATAIGSGTHISTPQLVRNGELIIYDQNGNRIFGGYATKFTDQTDRTVVYTKIEGVDYWQSFSRVVVNQIFSGQTDVQIIRTLLTTYAPWVGLQYLPNTATMTFASKNYRNKTLLDCLQDIIDSSGNQAWLDPYKNIRYVSPSFAQTAPFALSNNPDFRTSFQVGVDQFDIDDTAAINRVFFFGGKKPSNDFPQDISTQANGANTTFMLAYYPRGTSTDGKVHVKVNGVPQALGYISGATAADKLISQGGTANVLINADAHTLIFNVAPPAGAVVICTYRYELPLQVVLTSPTSYQFYGTYLDGTLSDTSVVDTNIAVQRCKILLLEQAFGLVTLKARCWRAGLQSGMSIRVDHSIRGIHNSFIIQEVDVVAKGNGLFEYHLTLGAWNWGLVDLLNHLIRASSTQDNASQEDTTIVDDQELTDQMHASFTTMKTVKPSGGYKVHASTLGDGFDAYCGFSSLGTVGYYYTVTADMPIRYYRLGEASGTVARDSGSQVQNGTIIGGVTLGQSGAIVSDANTSTLFDGSSSQISLPTAGLPSGSTSFSVEAWVKVTATPSSYSMIASWGLHTSGGAVEFGFDNTGHPYIGFSFLGGASTSPVTNNVWHHIVGTFNMSTSTTTLYIDGAQVQQNTFYPNITGSGQAWIGKGTDGGSLLNGYIDEVAVYSSALTASRIAAHFNMGTLGHE